MLPRERVHRIVHDQSPKKRQPKKPDSCVRMTPELRAMVERRIADAANRVARDIHRIEGMEYARFLVVGFLPGKVKGHILSEEVLAEAAERVRESEATNPAYTRVVVVKEIVPGKPNTLSERRRAQHRSRGQIA